MDFTTCQLYLDKLEWKDSTHEVAKRDNHSRIWGTSLLQGNSGTCVKTLKGNVPSGQAILLQKLLTGKHLRTCTEISSDRCMWKCHLLVDETWKQFNICQEHVSEICMNVCAHTDIKEYYKLININIKNYAQDLEKLHVVKYIENSMSSLITYCIVPLVLCCVLLHIY